VTKHCYKIRRLAKGRHPSLTWLDRFHVGARSRFSRLICKIVQDSTGGKPKSIIVSQPITAIILSITCIPILHYIPLSFFSVRFYHPSHPGACACYKEILRGTLFTLPVLTPPHRGISAHFKLSGQRDDPPHYA
jgi:hypothetical protein